MKSSLLPPLLLLLLVLGGWEGCSRAGAVDPVLVSAPSRIAAAAPGLLAEPAIRADLAFTLRAFGASLAVAVLVGVAVGLLIGHSPLAYQLLHPFVVVFNALPKIVLIPLIVLWLGIGIASNIFLGAMMAGFPIVIGTFTGVRCLEQDYLVMARSFRASRAKVFGAIVLPGITPFLLSALRVAVNYALVGVLIAEFYAASEGVGYRMVLFMANFRIEGFFVCLALVAAFSLLCTGLVHRLERRVEAWRAAGSLPA